MPDRRSGRARPWRDRLMELALWAAMALATLAMAVMAVRPVWDMTAWL